MSAQRSVASTLSVCPRIAATTTLSEREFISLQHSAKDPVLHALYSLSTYRTRGCAATVVASFSTTYQHEPSDRPSNCLSSGRAKPALTSSASIICGFTSQLVADKAVCFRTWPCSRIRPGLIGRSLPARNTVLNIQYTIDKVLLRISWTPLRVVLSTSMIDSTPKDGLHGRISFRRLRPKGRCQKKSMDSLQTCRPTSTPS